MYDIIFGFLIAYCIVTYTIAAYTAWIVCKLDSSTTMTNQQLRTAIALFLAAPLTVPAIGWELRNKPEN